MDRGRGCSTTHAATSDPYHEPTSLLAENWQDCPIDALRAEHIHVVQLSELLRSECFSRSKDHVTRVVDDDVEMPRFGK